MARNPIESGFSRSEVVDGPRKANTRMMDEHVRAPSLSSGSSIRQGGPRPIPEFAPARVQLGGAGEKQRSGSSEWRWWAEASLFAVLAGLTFLSQNLVLSSAFAGFASGRLGMSTRQVAIWTALVGLTVVGAFFSPFAVLSGLPLLLSGATCIALFLSGYVIGRLTAPQ